MNRLAQIGPAVVNILRTYPALSAALLNIAVVCAGYFGLHVTGDQLIYVGGVVTVLFGTLVHMGVIPIAKLAKASANPVAVVTVAPVVVTPAAETEKETASV
jgi:membrane protein YdbS with pleckstrin-like domain